MKFKLKLKHYTLYLGLITYIIGIALNIFYSLYSNQPGPQQSQSPLFELLSLFPPIIILALTLVSASIFEELAFRGWTIKHKFSKYISIIGILFYCFLATNSFIICVIVLALLIFVFFYKNDELSQFLKVIVTSLIFAFIHFDNFSDNMRYISILQLFGLSLIISYFALRFGFVYGILIHFANNLLATIIIFTTSVNYSTSIVKENYVANIEKIEFLENSSSILKGSFQDSIVHVGNITQIAVELAPFNNEVIYKAKLSSLDSYHYVAKCKNKGTCTLDRQELLKDFLNHTNLKTDTILVDAFILKITDIDKLQKHRADGQTTFIKYLVEILRNDFDIPIIINEDIADISFIMPDNFYRIFHKLSTEDKIKKLETDYGILLEKTIDKTVSVIYFFE
ncbi:MAG TPA: CPBP family intramembrane metalloprotease, partial [Bacteroidales bacterium]|nr:CPBP family intramembrane metalloprotease [Bacteroidales bacterium]